VPPNYLLPDLLPFGPKTDHPLIDRNLSTNSFHCILTAFR